LNKNSSVNNRQRNSHFRTIHEELISSLIIFICQVIQDSVLMIRILKNCWFLLEITIKSIWIYYTTYNGLSINEDKSSKIPSSKIFDEDFYTSLKSLYEILIDYLIKSVTHIKGQETELLNACKSSNRSLAMFIKVILFTNLSYSIWKFLFNLVKRYFENFHPCDNKVREF
jgi:hypothetical protein